MVLWTTVGIVQSSIHVLMEGTPEGYDPEEVYSVSNVHTNDSLSLSLEGVLVSYISLHFCIYLSIYIFLYLYRSKWASLRCPQFQMRMICTFGH
jgi:hypothetical protein